jgi:hypothetical protein
VAFKPFPEEEPLVDPAGTMYRCRGCGGNIADGMLIFPNIKGGKVMGIRTQPGWPGPDVPVTHECGTN